MRRKRSDLEGLSTQQLQKLYMKGKISLTKRNHILQNRLWRKNKKFEELVKKVDEAEAAVAKQNPFWFFQPNVGTIGERERAFLEEYLKPEDIPARVDSQLDALLCTSPEIGVAGGNGSSKTTTTIIKALIQCTGAIPLSLQGIFPEELLPKKFPQRWRFVGVSDDQLADTVLPRFKEWAPKEYLKNGSWQDSFASGHKILTLTYGKQEIGSFQFKTNRQDVETFQGPDIDGIVYDEETLSKIYDENLQRFRTAQRINILHGFTPTSGLTWLTDLFEGCGPDKYAERSLFMLCTATNQAANYDNLRLIFNKVREKNTYDVLKMRLLGEFISISGLAYGNIFNREIHVVPPFFENIPRRRRYEDYIVMTGWDPHYVTPTAGVFVLVDREGNCYVDRCYFEKATTGEVKYDFQKIRQQSGYRMGWSAFDKSCDSNIVAFGNRNIYKELTQGKRAIPGPRKSDKFKGSIGAGVDVIKEKLRAAAIKSGDLKGTTEEKPLYIVDRPENKQLINSFRTMERDPFPNEDIKGEKDAIREGRHHLHAALRYVFQNRINWVPAEIEVPEYKPVNQNTGW
jgi:hypothetical protein